MIGLKKSSDFFKKSKIIFFCIYERDFAQNNAVLKRKENEHGKELFEFK